MEEKTKEPSSIRLLLYAIRDGRKVLIQDMETIKNIKTPNEKPKEKNIII